MQKISLEGLSDILFSNIPQDIQKKYEKNVYGNTFTLRDQFISYCEMNWKFPKYSREESEKRVQKKLKNTDLYESDKFDFLIFDDLLSHISICDLVFGQIE